MGGEDGQKNLICSNTAMRGADDRNEELRTLAVHKYSYLTDELFLPTFPNSFLIFSTISHSHILIYSVFLFLFIPLQVLLSKGNWVIGKSRLESNWVRLADCPGLPTTRGSLQKQECLFLKRGKSLSN